ncbi:MAG: carboxymuconolactone decarboxylase family protein [bacterium]|nr:carboxymuconolactone decarboxylase family protein [bacterium]
MAANPAGCLREHGDMWIRTVPYEQAGDELRRHYDRQRESLGEVTEMTLAGSLYPRLVAARLELYAATERCPSALTSRQRNLIGFVTSALNGTVHCMSQVTVKLRADGFSDEEISLLASDPVRAAESLPGPEAALVRYTIDLTTRPGKIGEADVAALRAAGFDDLAIVDANAHCAHLNYVNRVVTGLGIHTVVDPDFSAYDAIPAD